MKNKITINQLYHQFLLFFIGTLSLIIYIALNPKYIENPSTILSINVSTIFFATFIFTYLAIIYGIVKHIIILILIRYLSQFYALIYPKYQVHAIIYKITSIFIFLGIAIPIITFYFMNQDKFIENTATFELYAIIAYVTIIATYFVQKHFAKHDQTNT
jgi:hypothetical protein